MRFFNAVTCLTFLFIVSACNVQRGNEAQSDRTNAVSPSNGGAHSDGAAKQEVAYDSKQTGMQPVSLVQASQSQAAQQVAVERKIIRDAEINLEVAAPAEGQRKLASIAEAHGGFVVTSEARLEEHDSQLLEIVTVQLRVPASHFDAALAEIRAVGTRVRAEKQTGKDVTEEFIDLDARLHTQRALEAQFLEIMKRAAKVSDALEVQTQLATVRMEIERVEGRRRFLENQAALSTINATLRPPAALVSVNSSGFFYGIKRAFGDGIDIAAMIILGLIRLGIALLPVLLLVVLPFALLWKYLLRPRFRRPKRGAPAPPVAGTAS
ncbi:MAG TPA: DUF4349 domain-containing protein [Pyrinomonadaceae bacterium]|jgi:hypothetical protein